MRKTVLRPLALAALLGILSSSLLPAAAESVESPNQRLKVVTKLNEDGENRFATYSVLFDGKLILDDSAIAFQRGDGVSIGQRLRQTSSPQRSSHKAAWRPVYGERSVVQDHYNELSLDYLDQDADCSMRLTFRCYDSGVAFKTTLKPQSATQGFTIKQEETEFRFLADHYAWCAHNAQGEYDKRRLSKLGKNVERPLVVETADGPFIAIGEAGLVDYARTQLRSTSDGSRLQTELSSHVRVEHSLDTPWRVVMVAESPGKLLENNDIFLNLSQPCAIADTSWIRPGKVLREITLTNAGARASIDFAERHNFQFVEFDAGWYGNEYDDHSDATTVTLDPKRSAGPFDLPDIIQYADQRGIGVILYVNRRELEKQLDVLLPLFKKWGVAGVKYGFVKVGSQEWTTWLHDAIRKAADHQLMVDVHDEYRPTGYSRTYPNLMTQEGVRGDEEAPPTEQTLTSLFTRSLAGATDFTVCYFNPRVDKEWTHAHQLAKAVCFYSPWQFLFWYDTPLAKSKKFDTIVETPELEFFDRMPTVWDETRVVHGSIGEYAVIARRSGEQWFVGALNNAKPRELKLPLAFLDDSTPYDAHIYEDDPEADSCTKVGLRKEAVSSETTLLLKLSSNGGQAILLTPASR